MKGNKSKFNSNYLRVILLYVIIFFCIWNTESFKRQYSQSTCEVYKPAVVFMVKRKLERGDIFIQMDKKVGILSF